MIKFERTSDLNSLARVLIATAIEVEGTGHLSDWQNSSTTSLAAIVWACILDQSLTTFELRLCDGVGLICFVPLAAHVRCQCYGSKFNSPLGLGSNPRRTVALYLSC